MQVIRARLVSLPRLLQASAESFFPHTAASSAVSTCVSRTHPIEPVAAFATHYGSLLWWQPALGARGFAARADEQTAGPAAGILSAVPFAATRQEADAAFDSYHSTDRNILLSK